ncbi:hypothetical protein BKM03_11885 [Pseudomonas avellanae]|uniref:Uncharacterized protein n=1 Tax=Pseudomonas avellanae TaxID=46257 RepID=A0AAD0GPV0_9PSED|nr:hypothetical protein BKM03_11885 [Pseudomonas avellanae]POP88170.1 hypothetical protein CXB34_04725 [Pseudomonas amygdali pv. morsprunorum]
MALRVTQRLCDISDVCLRLKPPCRPSAADFDGAKVGESPAPFPAHFVGFLSPHTYVALYVVSDIALEKHI